MPDNNNEVICHLIDVCEDAKGFYETAAQKAKDPYIESVFKSMAYIRSNIIVDLIEYVEANGGKPVRTGVLSGKAAPFFDGIAAGVYPDMNTDRELIVRLEETENHGLKEFYKAMDKNISLYAKAVLSQKLGMLSEAHNYMKGLKERLV